MPSLRETVTLSENLEEDALRFYAEARVPQAFRGADHRILAHAFKAAEGDWRRVSIDRNGVVMVHNRPVWTPE